MALYRDRGAGYTYFNLRSNCDELRLGSSLTTPNDVNYFHITVLLIRDNIRQKAQQTAPSIQSLLSGPCWYHSRKSSTRQFARRATTNLARLGALSPNSAVLLISCDCASMCSKCSTALLLSKTGSFYQVQTYSEDRLRQRSKYAI